MRAMVALVLCASVATAGCGAQLRVGPRVWPATSRASAPQGITRSYAERLPVGSTVEVALRTGQSFSATLMGVEDDGVRLQRRTRIPEEPFVVPLADLAMLALDQGGLGAAKAVLIGIGAGAAAFFGLLLVSLAAWAD